VTDERTQAERFSELFRAVYLTFHRRDGPRNQLPSASRAVLELIAALRALVDLAGNPAPTDGSGRIS
jgi:hypothetical protein